MKTGRQVTLRDYASPVAHWRAQPRWGKALLLFVGFPALAICAGFGMLSSDPTASPLWFEIAFGIAFVVIAITQVNLMRVLFRGHW